jgi:hypothetical protein
MTRALAVLALTLALLTTACTYHRHGHWGHRHGHHVERQYYDRHQGQRQGRQERPEVTEDNWHRQLDTREWRLKGPRYQKGRE